MGDRTRARWEPAGRACALCQEVPIQSRAPRDKGRRSRGALRARPAVRSRSGGESSEASDSGLQGEIRVLKRAIEDYKASHE
ncbi:hypothetical protein ZIOFF_054636 [Zingiber officinale]|uniref:Uncharacterized protein n=1 Tax=Zingiber officinale TaxID=94328 RepID=A0A8J5KMN9_ZINOF|nr:hypothetical protein ZIOFF_054636 [Zingiber officinale]